MPGAGVGRRGTVEVEIGLPADRVCGGDLVGESSTHEGVDSGGDLGDHRGDGDVVVGRDDRERLHVATEEVGLRCSELPPVDAACGRAFEERIVDIRGVLHVLDGVPGVEPGADEGVVGQVRRGVPEMGRVIGRDAAHVERGGSACRRRDG